MTKNSTQNDLIRFAYNELDKKSSNELTEKMITDENVFDDFIEIQKLKESLDKTEFSPSKITFDKIMHFAKANSKITSI